MKKTIQFLVILILCINTLIAQNGIQRYYNPIQPSPDITNLGRYGDIPVSKSNGIPNINIPIYTINVNNYKLPISISYHASGIKVAEEASSIGLGWTLFCGGVITQIVNGGNDFAYGGYINYDIPDPGYSGASNYSGYLPSGCNLEVDYTNITTAHNLFSFPYNCIPKLPEIGLNSPDLDTEPDFFYYNFGEYSGKFFWHKASNSFQTLNREKLKIDYLGLEEGWKLTTPDGVSYTFSAKEHYESCSQGGNGEGSVWGSMVPNSESYYLKEIKLPTNEIIAFNYILGEHVCQLATLSEDFVYMADKEPKDDGYSCAGCSDNTTKRYDGYGHHYNVIQTTYIPQYLDYIVFPNGIIKLHWQSRDDFQNAKKLTKIEVKRENGTLIKDITFGNETYFQGQTSTYHPYGYSQCNDPYSTLYCGFSEVNQNDILYKRLKLSSVKFSDQQNPYTFLYDESINLPSKQSYAQDYWGYFNGKITETTLLPQFYFEEIPVEYPTYLSSLHRADRKANDYSKAWMLTKITYPTGGYTLMEFEPNTFSNYSFPIQTGVEDRFCKGGGVRIKSIKDNSTNGVVNEKTYKYEYSAIVNGINVKKSYGKAMGIPKINRVFPFYGYDYDASFGTSSEGGQFYKGISYGQSAQGLSNTLQGNYVGYDKVIEIIGNEQANNGQIEYYYTNEPYYCNLESIAPGRYSLYNGIPNLIVYKNTSGTEIKKETFTYHPETDLIKSYGIKFELSSFGFYPNTYNLHSYPIQVSRILLKSKIESIYDPANQLWTSSEITYEYNPSGFIFKQSAINSDNTKTHTFISYPEEYVPNATASIQSLVDKYILKIPIEKVVVKEENPSIFKILDGEVYEYNSDGTGLVKTIFKMNNSLPISLNQFKFSWVNSFGILPTSSTIGPFSMSGYYEYPASQNYDYINNRVSLYTYNLTNMNAYIWGYNNTYPIAKAENSEYNEIAYTSFESMNEGNWFFTSGTIITNKELSKAGDTYFKMNGAPCIYKSLPAGKYRLEYWSKASSPAINGGTITSISTSGADDNGWIHYIKEITLSSPTSIYLTGYNIDIDELRLCPADAQMTTYTYDPLVGMTSQTDQNGVTTYYEYDGFGRLWQVKDQDGKVLKQNEYNYAH